MQQFLVVVVFFITAVTLMGASLKFANYKKGKSGCCGGTSCATGGDHAHNHSGKTCSKHKH